MGHYKGSKACSKSFKGKAVGDDSEQEVTDSDVESANKVIEEQVCASETEHSTEQGKEEEMAMIDYGRQAPAWRVKLQRTCSRCRCSPNSAPTTPTTR